jgi:hypothetical protein
MLNFLFGGGIKHIDDLEEAESDVAPDEFEVEEGSRKHTDEAR